MPKFGRNHSLQWDLDSLNKNEYYDPVYMAPERFQDGAKKSQNTLRSHGIGSKFNFIRSNLETIF